MKIVIAGAGLAAHDVRRSRHELLAVSAVEPAAGHGEAHVPVLRVPQEVLLSHRVLVLADASGTLNYIFE